MDKINLEYLEEVSLGNKQIMDEMIDIFLEQVPEFVDQFNEYYNKKDYKNIGKVAHKAKSSTSIVGLSKLTNLLKEIEVESETSKDDSYFEKNIKLFEKTCEQAVKDLKEVLNKK